MKTFTALLCALLLAGSTFADPYVIAKQQAKNAVATEERNQQAIDSSGASAPILKILSPARRTRRTRRTPSR
jgi:hypothetical protein